MKKNLTWRYYKNPVTIKNELVVVLIVVVVVVVDVLDLEVEQIGILQYP